MSEVCRVLVDDGVWIVIDRIHHHGQIDAINEQSLRALIADTPLAVENISMVTVEQHSSAHHIHCHSNNHSHADHQGHTWMVAVLRKNCEL